MIVISRHVARQALRRSSEFEQDVADGPPLRPREIVNLPLHQTKLSRS
jgi:hypothetical protein